MDYLELLKSRQIMAIAPHFDGIHSSVIYTHQGTLYAEETVEDLMDRFCMAFCCTFEGRLDATRRALKFKKNPPILISEHYQIAAFQVPDILKMGSVWIFDLDFKIKSIDASACEVIFPNHLSIPVPLSSMSILKRRRRTFELLYKFSNNRT